MWGVPTLGKSSVSCVRWVTPGHGTKARCGRSWHCGVWSAQPGGPRRPLSGGLRDHHHRHHHHGVPLPEWSQQWTGVYLHGVAS